MTVLEFIESFTYGKRDSCEEGWTQMVKKFIVDFTRTQPRGSDALLENIMGLIKVTPRPLQSGLLEILRLTNSKAFYKLLKQ